LELDDIGDTIEKIRIGHDGKGWGVGWHLDKVQIRRLLEKSKVRWWFELQNSLVF